MLKYSKSRGSAAIMTSWTKRLITILAVQLPNPQLICANTSPNTVIPRFETRSYASLFTLSSYWLDTLHTTRSGVSIRPPNLMWNALSLYRGLADRSFATSLAMPVWQYVGVHIGHKVIDDFTRGSSRDANVGKAGIAMFAQTA
jgi:hypothetical protein